MGQAALRDQKIGNALRTIDTWYPAYEERRVPLPVEPNGASLDAQEFFRNKGDASGVKLLLRLSELDPMTPDGLFLLACIIRGGGFSGSECCLLYTSILSGGSCVYLPISKCRAKWLHTSP